jgi:hypothetical protein
LYQVEELEELVLVVGGGWGTWLLLAWVIGAGGA